MRNILFALALSGAVVGCTTAEQSAVVGGVGGALVGGAVGGTEGALIGAGAGAVGGYLIGRAATSGMCVYEDRRTGRRYEDRC